MEDPAEFDHQFTIRNRLFDAAIGRPAISSISK